MDKLLQMSTRLQFHKIFITAIEADPDATGTPILQVARVLSTS
ncbi:unnamed protein product [Cuscuta epithymum]|uniref:Uncharacterized protein n=1 Tax=Cuscuta epithymum TaxID=186058 RepID=A0AAV0G0F9_9ASTE|nr:unnamed protein product [Cuscuta epithymum]